MKRGYSNSLRVVCYHMFINRKYPPPGTMQENRYLFCDILTKVANSLSNHEEKPVKPQSFKVMKSRKDQATLPK